MRCGVTDVMTTARRRCRTVSQMGEIDVADVFGRPGFAEHTSSLDTAAPDPVPGPNRAELEELRA